MKANLNDLKLELWLRQRNRGEIIWDTKDGKEIPIGEMSDEHLINAIKRLLKYYEKKKEIDDLNDLALEYEAYLDGLDIMDT